MKSVKIIALLYQKSINQTLKIDVAQTNICTLDTTK